MISNKTVSVNKVRGQCDTKVGKLDTDTQAYLNEYFLIFPLGNVDGDDDDAEMVVNG